MSKTAERELAEVTICFCHNVTNVKLLEVIRAGADTLHDIQAETCASTGCGGCEWDVRDILEQELAAKKARSGL